MGWGWERKVRRQQRQGMPGERADPPLPNPPTHPHRQSGPHSHCQPNQPLPSRPKLRPVYNKAPFPAHLAPALVRQIRVLAGCAGLPSRPPRRKRGP